MRDWASVASRGRLLLTGSVAHASLKTAVVFRKWKKSRREREVSRGHPCLLRVAASGGRGGRGVEPGVAARPREAGEGGADGELRRQAGHRDGVHRVVVVRVRRRLRLQGGRGGRAEAALGGAAAAAAVRQVLPVRGAQVLVSGKPLLKHNVATSFGTVHK